MHDDGVRVFFYGSFINREVLAEVGLRPKEIEVARLWGFDLRIQPLANLVPADGSCAYGIVCRATHAKLAELYGQAWVGTYHPYPVLVECQDGRLQPALCYLAPPRETERAEAAYIDRIARPARELGFPRWYLERIESFRSGPRED